MIRAEAPARTRRNAPDQIPVVIIGRLAVHRRWQGRGVGTGLLRDALGRILTVSETVGCAAVLVHAIDGAAARFYQRYGFEPFPSSGRTLFLPMETLRRGL